MPEPLNPLPADHAFVLQLQKCPEGTKALRCGRIEHLATGEAASFTTPEGLWDFIDEVLAELKRDARARSQEGRS